ncbi:hypothetical protein B0H14DRAFT_3089255 [Mycena olivaceomarginata]|nr:hypothetical protein B0H14DRAFT_3089255 [Mycena olivaceomarginata]
MNPEAKQEFIRLQHLAADDDWEDMSMDVDPSTSVNIDAIMEGSERIELSHAGGELRQSIEEEMEEEIIVDRRWDWRTRRDRMDRLNQQFVAQMPEMLKAYMRWCESVETGRERSTSAEVWTITVVDMFGTDKRDVSLDPQGGGIAPALIMEGLIPCAPFRPSVAITVKVLEVYRVAHARCPQLAIQSFVKTLCDLHGTPYLPYLRKQFAICYDLYLDLRRNSEKTVLKSLGRDSFSWRLKHACPACMYKLKGEAKLIYDILVAMDGNNSLKRILRRCKVHSDGDTGTGAEFVLGKSKEYTDNRDAGENYYRDREKVNEWSKQCIAEMMPKEAIEVPSDEPNPCADRWKNMVEDITAKMWGIFDETGIFLCLCRHGFVLMIVDMIKSGELAKYPLAVVDSLIKHLGDNIGNGYDVGCDFQTTIKNSPLAARARQCNFRCLVGAFHGHAHNRLCQLCNLATYVLGLGCEDLEGCERFFSGSNRLAKSCRYASRFHQQQEITSYVKHYDSFHTYANLSKFITNNYKQAINILKKEDALRVWMREEGIADYSVFRIWLEEEKTFLLGLKAGSKDQSETLEMEYVQKLVNLDASRYAPSFLARRHAREKVDRDLEAVQELEEKLGISDRWTSESPQWTATVQQVKQKKYQKALDAVELLVVERIFELTKINQSQTGYKLRRHIAKALQARSKAVPLDPPLASLTWEQVVEYTFLADFDILRDTRAEIQSRPWTRPAYRLAMDTYFKIERAREELVQLNIEIRRTMTWIRDEGHFLWGRELSLRSTEGKTPEQAKEDLLLAVQMKLYREQRGRFDDDHRDNFRRLAKLKGFTGSISPGIAVEILDGNDDEEELTRPDESDDEGIEAHEETLSRFLYQVSMVSIDDRTEPLGDDE